MADKPIKCTACNRRFATERAMRQHHRDAHDKANAQRRRADPYAGMSKAQQVDLLADITEDMGDGAFFAVMQEMGLELEDLPEE